MDALLHAKGDLRTAGITVDEIGRSLAGHSPTVIGLEVREGVTDDDRDRGGSGSAAVVPLLHNGVIGSGRQLQVGVQARTAGRVRQLVGGGINTHGIDALGAGGGGGCDKVDGRS